MTEILLSLVGSAFIVSYLFYGMGQMEQKHMRADKKRIAAELAYITVMILLGLSGNTVLNLVLLLGMPVLALWVNRAQKGSLIGYYSLVIAVYLTDLLAGVILGSVFGQGILYFTNPKLTLFAYIVTLRFLEFLVIRVVLLAVKRHQGEKLTGKQVAVSLLLPAFSIFNMLSMAVLLQVFFTSEMMAVFLLNMVSLLVLNLFFSVLADTMGKNQRLERELELLKQQTDMQLAYYEKEEQKYRESRKVIHDIRNHLQTLEQLYAAGEESAGAQPLATVKRNNQAWEAAASYTGEIHGMLNELGQTFYTKDLLLNIILNDKMAVIRQKGIQGDFKAGEIDLSAVKNVDVTGIFSNLLDNAIAAAEKSDNAFVRLKICQVNGFLSISMENSADREPAWKNGIPQSEKSGHEGLGIKNIRRIVEKYDGDLQMRWEDGIFYTSVMLTLP